MLAGGIFLSITAAALGEFHNFHPSAVSHGAWLALLYLTVFGSIIAFTAYTWLLHHESPTKVGTYAYVNPSSGRATGIFPRRRGARPANNRRKSVRADQRGCNHHDENKKARRRAVAGRRQLNYS